MKATLIKGGQLGRCLLSYGIIDLFRKPKQAAMYWRHIAVAALSPEQSDLAAGLTMYDISQVVPGVESIPVTIIDYQYAAKDVMPLNELMNLGLIVRHRQPKVIFEIGTYMGNTTLQLAANSHAEVYTLDLPPRDHKEYVQPKVLDPELDVYPDRPGFQFMGSPYADRIHQLYGDSQEFDFTPYYGRVDLVFVDGCHHYKYVSCDTQSALKMISPDGIVIWHDYAPYAPGVVQALEELSKQITLTHIVGTSLVIYWPAKPS